METKTKKSYYKGGRKPKADPAIYRYGIKLNSEENGRFELMFQKSGLYAYSRFIKAKIFNTPIKVFKIDKNTRDYYIRLTNFYHQFQAIGNNYNQTVFAIKKTFGERSAVAYLAKLEKYTLDLVIVSKKIEALTREYEEKYLRRENFENI